MSDVARGVAPADERRWTRGAWLTLAFVVCFALFSAAVSALVLRLPSEGCVVADPSGASQIVAACYGERPTPLSPGDELLATGGVSLIVEEDEFWAPSPLPEGWGAGATIDYTIRRDGNLLTLPVPIEPLSWAGVAQVFAYTASTDAGDYVLYVGFLLIFLLAPQGVAARALFVCFGAHFAVTKLGWAGSPGWA